LTRLLTHTRPEKAAPGADLVLVGADGKTLTVGDLRSALEAADRLALPDSYPVLAPVGRTRRALRLRRLAIRMP
jgi:hypothetical protein